MEVIWGWGVGGDCVGEVGRMLRNAVLLVEYCVMWNAVWLLELHVIWNVWLVE